MNHSKFWDNLKIQVNEVKEETLSELLKKDEQYLDANKQRCQAENDYQGLNLTEEQIEVIKRLLHWTDCSSIEYSTLSYLAGLKDSQRISEYFNTKDIMKDTIVQKKHILEYLYCGEIYPAKQVPESLELKSYLAKMHEEETKFNNSLDVRQKEQFKEILRMRTEYLSMCTTEEFIYGFQVGAKMIIGVYTDYFVAKE